TFARVLAGDDAFAVRDVIRQTVQHGSLTRAGTTGNEKDHAAGADDLKKLGADRVHGAEFKLLLLQQHVPFESAGRHARPLHRQRRDDDVDARSVRQTGVANGAGFVDAAADRTDDALAHGKQVRVVIELDGGAFDLAVDLDIGRLGAVDHDIGDVVAGQ